MTDSTDNARGPDRIWLTNFVKEGYGARIGRGTVSDLDHGPNPDYPEYIRADLAPDPLGDARVKALVVADWIDSDMVKANQIIAAMDVPDREMFVRHWLSSVLRALAAFDTTGGKDE